MLRMHGVLLGPIPIPPLKIGFKFKKKFKRKENPGHLVPEPRPLKLYSVHLLSCTAETQKIVYLPGEKNDLRTYSDI